MDWRRTYPENFSLLVLATAGPEGSADRLYRSNPWFVYMPVSVAVLISPYSCQKVDGGGVRVSAGSTLRKRRENRPKGTWDTAV